MKKKFYLLLLAFSSAGLFAQNFALVYEPTVPDDYVVIRDVTKTADGDILAGFDLMSGSVPHAGIMKTDADGMVIWSKTLNIPASQAGCTFEVAEKADGNLYLWGLSKEAETNHMRAILSEMTADGEMLWSKEYDFGTNATTAYTINKMAVLPSGDLQMMIAVFHNVIVMKTDATGEIIWAKASAMGPPDEGGKNPGFEWLAIPDDGGMCASKAENDFSLLRYSEDGELLWNKAYYMGGYTHGKTICRSTNGNILVAGFIAYTPHIMEISDEDGTINWVKKFEGVTLPFLGKAHLANADDKIILDFTTDAGMQYILEMSETGEVLKTMMSKYGVMDYNKIEYTGADEKYFYGSMVTGAGTEGMIHRTGDVLTESCMIREVEVGLVTTDHLTFSEIDFTPYESDFTSQEDIDITLDDMTLRAKFACGVYLTTPEETTQIAVYPNPSSDNFTVVLTDDLLNAAYALTDLSGKQVLSGIVTNSQMQIDLTNVADGQYVLSVGTADKLMTEKITVIK